MTLRHLRLSIPATALPAFFTAIWLLTFSVRWLRAQEPEGTAAGETAVALEAGGEHLRIVSPHGIIHVWRPGAYRARSAGIVVYVHGYFTDVDQTWTDEHLAEQFQASGRNALFIAPEAPTWPGEGVRWKDFSGLLQDVWQGWDKPLPSGPIVLVGHSAAYRTIVNWLHEPRVKTIILLDGLYRNQRQFRRWLRVGRGSHQMVLVANETAHKSQRFARRVPQARRLDRVPDELTGFTSQQKRARLLVLHSQYEHMEIVSSGKVIPVLLGLTPLSTLPAPAQAAASDESSPNP